MHGQPWAPVFRTLQSGQKVQSEVSGEKLDRAEPQQSRVKMKGEGCTTTTEEDYVVVTLVALVSRPYQYVRIAGQRGKLPHSCKIN